MKLKRKLLAAMVGGAIAAPAAMAQTSGGVQLYGGIDLSVINYRLTASGATPSVSRWNLYSSGLRSIWGLRGQENLGGGLTAWFQLESVISADGRINATIQPAFNLGGRNSALGLRGAWGDLLLGNWDAPYKVVTFPIIVPTTHSVAGVYGSILGNVTGQGNADTTGSVPNPNCQNLPGTGAPTAAQPVGAQTEGNTTGFVRRLSDTVQYWSPTFSGAQFKVAFQAPEAEAGTTGQNPMLWSASLNWAGGPVGVGLGYQTHRDFQFNGGKDNAWNLTATYAFTPAIKVGAYYEDISTDGPAPGLDIDARNWALNAVFGIGSGEFTAVYARARDPEGAGAIADAGGNAWTVGYRHHMSKRTDLYAFVGTVDNDSGATRTFLSPPNNSAGQPAAITAGQDSRAFGVGVTHRF